MNKFRLPPHFYTHVSLFPGIALLPGTERWNPVTRLFRWHDVAYVNTHQHGLDGVHAGSPDLGGTYRNLKEAEAARDAENLVIHAARRLVGLHVDLTTKDPKS